jgi:2-phosphosulfolactate phosphatase
MARARPVAVHLLPELVEPASLVGGVAIVIDVLRATTTIVHALAAGCTLIRPVAEVDAAQQLADHLPAGKVLLAGERNGKPLSGFDLGNSPREYTSAKCAGTTLVLTTTNGTRALIRAATAARVLVGAFVNYSAVCEQLRHDERPLHVICAGNAGTPALEDTLLAGGFVEFVCAHQPTDLNDSARLAWDTFENHRNLLDEALALSSGGTHLQTIGYGADLALAAKIDAFNFVPELRTNPLRIEIGAIGVRAQWWNF